MTKSGGVLTALCLMLLLAAPGCSPSPGGNTAESVLTQETAVYLQAPLAFSNPAPSPSPSMPNPALPADRLPADDGVPAGGSAAASDSKELPAPDPAPSATSLTIPPAGSPSVTASVYNPNQAKVRIPVLNYHSIAIDPGNPAALTPDKLEAQLSYLAEEGYTTLTLQQFTDIMEDKQKPPAKPVLLTFDDGYTDNYETAMPLIRKYDFHATLFMTPGWVDKPGYLSWEQVKEMQKAGWDVMPHGMSHPKLNQLNAERQAQEIIEARKLIEAQLGVTADIFCYPYGLYNKQTLAILKEQGFRYAFTIDQGFTDPGQQPLQLKRIFVDGNQSLPSFIRRLK
ncbi:polysaccharide deacetylase family protein [Paenibacillus sp. y28]|uniref:polysaccharide deacetylase family protein n=1 Tax=Paenibacillus sp. y28 TaxID=3129110 RepID=UPI003015EE38